MCNLLSTLLIISESAVRSTTGKECAYVRRRCWLAVFPTSMRRPLRPKSILPPLHMDDVTATISPPSIFVHVVENKRTAIRRIPLRLSIHNF